MQKFIDVSSYNGKVDWAKAKNQGVGGAILKIIRKDLEQDKQFSANRKGCETQGIPWGVYNYSYANTTVKAKSDMKLICDILDKLDKDHMTLGVWFDIEDDVQAVLTKKQIADIINAAQDVVEGRGYSFGVYTGLSYYKTHIDTDKVKCKNFWIARYYNGYSAMTYQVDPNEKYKPLPSCFAWQYTSSGTFSPAISAGNGGKVDLNVLYRSYSAISGTKTDTGETTSTETTTAEITAITGYTGTFPALPSRGYYKLGDGYKTLTKYGTQIKRVQKFINWAVGSKLTLDGDYGEKTAAAVKKFQKAAGLTQDGEYGKKTLAASKAYKK